MGVTVWLIGVSCWTRFLNNSNLHVSKLVVGGQGGTVDEFAAVGSLADPVRRQVYEYVAAQREPVGREQTASATGLPLHTARFHLERLVEEGLLTTEFRRLSGRSGPGAGRPAKLYGRADAEVSVTLPPRCYDLVGSVLASAIAAALEGEPLPEALHSEASRRGREAGAEYGGRGRDVARARGLLAQEGFEPTDDGAGLTLRNCPFDALAREHPALVCGVNHDYVAGALEGLGCRSLSAQLDPAEDRCCVRVVGD
jgi:predicted ArsR family transcriptional regulator